MFVLADHWVKLKEIEKKDKYLELARELKKKTMEHECDGDWYQFGALGTVTKVLVKGQEDLEIRGRVETIQTTA